VAFCSAVHFPGGILSGWHFPVWHFVRWHFVRDIFSCGILSSGIMSGILCTYLLCVVQQSGETKCTIRQLALPQREVARKLRDVAAVVFGLKFATTFTTSSSSQASKARLQSSKRIGAKQDLTQISHSMSRVLESLAILNTNVGLIC